MFYVQRNIYLNDIHNTESSKNSEINKNCNIDLKYGTYASRCFQEVFNLKEPVDLLSYVCIDCQNMPLYDLKIANMKLSAIKYYLEDNFKAKQGIERWEEELKKEIEEKIKGVKVNFSKKEEEMRPPLKKLRLI